MQQRLVRKGCRRSTHDTNARGSADLRTCFAHARQTRQRVTFNCLRDSGSSTGRGRQLTTVVDVRFFINSRIFGEDFVRCRILGIRLRTRRGEGYLVIGLTKGIADTARTVRAAAATASRARNSRDMATTKRGLRSHPFGKPKIPRLGTKAPPS